MMDNINAAMNFRNATNPLSWGRCVKSGRKMMQLSCVTSLVVHVYHRAIECQIAP